MRINKLNEANNTLNQTLCIGAKTYGRTLCFGSFKKDNKYTVMLVENTRVKGGSQVCFKDIYEFNKFNSEYYNGELELIHRSLQQGQLPLHEVETTLGKLWMKDDYFRTHPPISQKEFQYAIAELRGYVTHNNLLEAVSSRLKEILLPPIIEALDELDIPIKEHSHILYYTTISKHVRCSLPLENSNEEIDSKILSAELTELLGYNTQVAPTRGYIDMIIAIPNVRKLMDKIANKIREEVNNLPSPPSIDQEVWDYAKQAYNKSYQET